MMNFWQRTKARKVGMDARRSAAKVTDW